MDVLRPDMVFIGNRCYRKNMVQTQIDKSFKDQEESFPFSQEGKFTDFLEFVVLFLKQMRDVQVSGMSAG
jgi:hypothetical protein